MRRPHCNLRALMTAVAVVGVEFALLVSVSGPIHLDPPYGPLVGIAWAFCRLRGRRYAYLRAALWGAGVQAVPITLFMAGFLVFERASGIDRVGNEWSSIAFDPLVTSADEPRDRSGHRAVRRAVESRRAAIAGPTKLVTAADQVDSPMADSGSEA